jgi:hypothetical protein
VRSTGPGCWPHARGRADYPPFVQRGPCQPRVGVASRTVAGRASTASKSSPASYLPLPAVWAFIAFTTITPAADFCRTVRVNRSTLSHDFVTCNRSPEVSSIAFHAQPLDLPPVLLMDVGFAIMCSLARHRRPQIQFLSHRLTCLLHASFRPHLAVRPLRFAITSPPSDCEEDFHLQAIEHARHTKKKPTLCEWAESF